MSQASAAPHPQEPRSAEDSESCHGRAPKRPRALRIGLVAASLAGGALLGLAFAFRGPSFLSVERPSGGVATAAAPWSIKSGRRLMTADDSPTEYDFSGSSCGDILPETSDLPPDARCAYARTCNGGDGLLLPSAFCTDPMTLGHAYHKCALLSPLLLLYLVVLFRMLGSTAEDFFAPCPEMLSTRLGLPPRFAGASLLALGNGAPDVSATVNSILSDPKNGYDLALGALTGGGMFVGTAVAGSAILANGGVPCRGALLRDVSAYAMAIGLVVFFFRTGTIGGTAVAAFFLFYGLYASSVLASDLYHRKVVVPREQAKEEKRALHRQAKMLDAEKGKAGGPPLAEDVSQVTTASDEDGESDEESEPVSDLPFKDRVMEMMSNYDMTLSTRSMGTPVVLHGPGGVLADRGHHHHHCHLTPHGRDGYTPLPAVAETELTSLGAEGEGEGEVHVEDGIVTPETDNTHELLEHWKELWHEVFDETQNPLEKFLLAVELPFTMLRMLSIPVPCEGYYCRPTVALSLALSPLWIGFYAYAEYGVNLFLHDGVPCVALMCIPSFLVGAMTWRYADETEMSVSAAAPVALYGFLMAATWIDFIGDRLVTLLQFLGVVLHVPGPVMGLTVLAWGDSMGDLAANVALAKKGLANMAMTACFASPLFNMLIGLGIGFSAIGTGTAVHISPSVKTGFLFLLCNLIMVPTCGRLLNEGKIPEKYAYVMFGLYGCYIVTSILLEFME